MMFVIRHGKTNTLYGYHRLKTHIVAFKKVEHARQVAGSLSHWHDTHGEFPIREEGVTYTGDFRNPLDADLEVSVCDEGELTLNCAFRDWNLTVIENIDQKHITGTVRALSTDSEEDDSLFGPLDLWKSNLERDYKEDY